MTGRGAIAIAFVVGVLAGHAYAQPSATPPTPPPPPPSPAATPPPLPAPPPPGPEHTVCFFGRPFECASVLLAEIGVRAAPGIEVTTVDVGLLIHDGSNAYGGTVGFVAITDAEISAMVAARYRRYLGSWGMAADVAVGYADGAMLEVALGWGDVVAVTAGVNQYQLEDGDQRVVATAGLRIGSVTIGGLFYTAIVVGTASR